MIKKTLYFGNPAYLSLRNSQLVIKLPEVERNDTLPTEFKQEAVRTIPIEDIGVVLLDNKQITVTQGLMEALLENNCAVITIVFCKMRWLSIITSKIQKFFTPTRCSVVCRVGRCGCGWCSRCGSSSG